MAPRSPFDLSRSTAGRIWLRAQRLDEAAPFGAGHEAVSAAVSHLGYVQIDTINVIERCHHHILWTRIPEYRRDDLHRAQFLDKSVFEYWTHALSYVPAVDWRFFLPAMKRFAQAPRTWFGPVTKTELHKVLTLVRDNGPLTIRDIADDVLVEKNHPWASRKPSKRALQFLFYTGALTISRRSGMLKIYELTDRHFGWEKRPRPASQAQVVAYLLDRALRSQGLVSLDSICHLEAGRKAAVREAIEGRVRRGQLVPVALESAGKVEHWAQPKILDALPETGEPRVHVLSPFDPLVIQRKRLKMFFGYEHRFEAYVPKAKRVLGYFALPVLVGGQVVAALDLKTDRRAGKLLIQQWTSFDQGAAAGVRAAIEEELHRFERFQLERPAEETAGGEAVDDGTGPA